MNKPMAAHSKNKNKNNNNNKNNPTFMVTMSDV